MADKNKQIAALKKLSALYWQGDKPDTFTEREPPDNKLVEQLTLDGMKLVRRIDAARRELLATGFPVPNSWLTVRAIPLVTDEQWRVGKSSKWRQRIKITCPERDLLMVILKEMYAERMRLEFGDVAESAKPIDPTPSLPWKEWAKAIECDPRTAKKKLSPYMISDLPTKGRKSKRTFRLEREGMPEEYLTPINAMLDILFPVKIKGAQQTR